MIPYKHAIEEKKQQQVLKKAQMETEKLERAEKHAVAKKRRKTNAEIACRARFDRAFFS